MNFSPVSLTTSTGTTAFNPYDRGAKGAFVWRDASAQLNAQRLVVSTETRDDLSDRYSVQTNTPRPEPVQEGCCPLSSNSILGTDLIKTDLRILATTSEDDRVAMIKLHIAALQEFEAMMSKREKLYS